MIFLMLYLQSIDKNLGANNMEDYSKVFRIDN